VGGLKKYGNMLDGHGGPGEGGKGCRGDLGGVRVCFKRVEWGEKGGKAQGARRGSWGLAEKGGT